MKYSLRSLMIVALLAFVSGCPSGGTDKDEIQFYPPGPEFKKSQASANDTLPTSPAPAPNPPKP